MEKRVTLVTMSLGELCLSAHPQKTVQVVTGSEEYIRNMMQELEENPTVIQQFEVRRVESEKYLTTLLVYIYIDVYCGLLLLYIYIDVYCGVLLSYIYIDVYCGVN